MLNLGLTELKSLVLKHITIICHLFIRTIIIEYVYGLQLHPDELPEYKQIGLVRHYISVTHLSIKMGLLFFHWSTLRLFLMERCKTKSQATDETLIISNSASPDLFGIGSSNTITKPNIQTKIVDLIHSILIKYWINLSSSMLLLISCQNDVVAYRIGYMCLFVYLITAFQVSNFYSFFLLKSLNILK